METRFRNRTEAAELLAEKLADYRNEDPLILAIPRGGVVMGEVLTTRLNGELDTVLVRKIGAPGNPEYAVGAVTELGEVILTEEAQAFEFSAAFFKKAARDEIEKLRKRRHQYTPFLQPIPIKNRTVLLVDDGIATGQTILAAISAIRRHNPKKIVVCAAVASKQAATTLLKVAEDVVVLYTPEDFVAVSLCFDDFAEVSDEEVARILASRVPVVLPPTASGNI